MDDPRRSASRAPARPVRIAVAVFYTLLFFALMWPVYPRFATIEPRVLLLPFSLFYVVVGLVLSFLVLLAFHFWEAKGGGHDSGTDARRGSPADRPRAPGGRD